MLGHELNQTIYLNSSEFLLQSSQLFIEVSFIRKFWSKTLHNLLKFDTSNLEVE